MSDWSQHTAPDGRPYYHNYRTGQSTWERPADFLHPPMPAPPSPSVAPVGGYGGYDYAPSRGYGAAPAHGYGYGAGGYGGYGGPGMGAGYAGVPAGPGAPIQKGPKAQGPPGANLFIFHIPNNMTTRQLFDIFAAYGNVISARIMVERETGRSRGFGFVSYDSPAAADAAIHALDGYQVGNKRLKVSLKAEKDGGRDGDSGSAGGGGSRGMGGMAPMGMHHGYGGQMGPYDGSAGYAGPEGGMPGPSGGSGGSLQQNDGGQAVADAGAGGRL